MFELSRATVIAALRKTNRESSWDPNRAGPEADADEDDSAPSDSEEAPVDVETAPARRQAGARSERV